MDALPAAVMYKVPFIIIVLDNGFLGLIRQAEKYIYEMEYEVEICYDCFQECTYEELPKMAEAGSGTALEGLAPGKVAYIPENEGRGFNFVKFAEACGLPGSGFTIPMKLRPYSSGQLNRAFRMSSRLFWKRIRIAPWAFPLTPLENLNKTFKLGSNKL
ncbi:MAG: hypothetical protein PVG06_13270 [Desulfobacterales bacterium]